MLHPWTGAPRLNQTPSHSPRPRCRGSPKYRRFVNCRHLSRHRLSCLLQSLHLLSRCLPLRILSGQCRLSQCQSRRPNPPIKNRWHVLTASLLSCLRRRVKWCLANQPHPCRQEPIPVASKQSHHPGSHRRQLGRARQARTHWHRQAPRLAFRARQCRCCRLFHRCRRLIWTACDSVRANWRSRGRGRVLCCRFRQWHKSHQSGQWKKYLTRH